MANSKEEIEAGIKAMLWSKPKNDAPTPHNRGSTKAAKSPKQVADHSRPLQTVGSKPDQGKKQKKKMKNAKQENGQWQTQNITPKSESQNRPKSAKGGNVGKGKNSSDSSLSTNYAPSPGKNNPGQLTPDTLRLKSRDGLIETPDSAAKSQSRRQKKKKKKKDVSSPEVDRESKAVKKTKNKKSENAKNIPGTNKPAIQMEDTVADFFKKAGSVAQNLSPNDVDIIAKLNLGPQDAEFSKEVLEELERDFLFRLKKRSTKFPNAKFFCRLCDYHCDTVPICRSHIKDTRHRRLRELRTTDILLRNLPPPATVHCVALTELLDKVSSEQSLSPENRLTRQIVAERIQQIINKSFPGVRLVMYGSSETGFALNDSDLNLHVNTDKCGENPALILAKIFLLIRNDKSDFFSDVSEDFSAKVPCIKLTAKYEGLVRCMLSINSASAVQTTVLLANYSRLDPRVAKLAIAFRYWAKLCKVDKQDRGTLPAYVWSLMVVYYLQRTSQPVLPILHELYQLDEKENKAGKGDLMSADISGTIETKWTCENTQSVGALWYGMLRFYSIEFDMTNTVITIVQKGLSREEKKWNNKKFAVEDPYSRKRNVARSVSHSHVFEYIYDRLRAAFMYYGVPQTKSGAVYDKMDPSQIEKQLQEKYKQQDQTENGHSDLQNNSVASDGTPISSADNRTSPSVVNSPSIPTVAHQEAHSDNKTDSSTSGKQTDPNSSHSKQRDSSKKAAEISSNSVSETTDSLDDQVPSSGQPVNSSGAEPQADAEQKFAEDITKLVIKLSLEKAGQEEGGVEEGHTAANGTADDKESRHCTEAASSPSDEFCPHADSSSGEDIESAEEDEEDEDETTSSGDDADAEEEEDSDDAQNSAVILKDVKKYYHASDLSYKFDEETLSDGIGPAIMCSLCHAKGHLKENCPDEYLPEPEPLPRLTRQYVEALNQVLHQVPGDFEPQMREVKMRERVVRDVERYIQDTYQDARLELFGSSCNGFGFRHSDLDICMTLGAPTAEGLDCVQIIKTLAKALWRYRDTYDVIPITTAKVPIVKFKHRPSQFECDISLYNALAKHNTRMLKLYSDIDYRVKALGYIMKVFGKVCDICDASRGSLSSYAYILIVLYFLQQRKPPVIPVLQELHKGNKTPTRVVEGWNAWFQEDVASIQHLWPAYGQNKESVAELWVGLLRFYSEEFNFRETVISIRQLNPLSRFEKLWNGKCIAIEDPFDLSHNLGAGVSRKMNMFILKAFRRGRVHFGTPISKLPPGHPNLAEYLFNSNYLTEGTLPNDRGCRACGRVGHFSRECPRVVQRKNRKSEGRGGEDEDGSAERHGGPGGPGGRRNPRDAHTPEQRGRANHDNNWRAGNQQQQHRGSLPQQIPRRAQGQYNRSLSQGSGSPVGSPQGHLMGTPPWTPTTPPGLMMMQGPGLMPAGGQVMLTPHSPGYQHSPQQQQQWWGR